MARGRGNDFTPLKLPTIGAKLSSLNGCPEIVSSNIMIYAKYPKSLYVLFWFYHQLLRCYLEEGVMAILDSRGRLFGKVNLLDLGALLVILLVIFGVFFFPGSPGSLAQINSYTKPVEVDLFVQGLKLSNPQELFNKELAKGNKTNVIIRKEPHGAINIKSIQQLPRTILVTLADGDVKEIPDPKKNNFSTDIFMTLSGIARITDNGPVIGSSQVKIGDEMELDGFNYHFKATILDVRVKDK